MIWWRSGRNRIILKRNKRWMVSSKLETVLQQKHLKHDSCHCVFQIWFMVWKRWSQQTSDQTFPLNKTHAEIIFFSDTKPLETEGKKKVFVLLLHCFVVGTQSCWYIFQLKHCFWPPSVKDLSLLKMDSQFTGIQLLSTLEDIFLLTLVLTWLVPFDGYYQEVFFSERKHVLSENSTHRTECCSKQWKTETNLYFTQVQLFTLSCDRNKCQTHITVVWHIYSCVYHSHHFAGFQQLNLVTTMRENLCSWWMGPQWLLWMFYRWLQERWCRCRTACPLLSLAPTPRTTGSGSLDSCSMVFNEKMNGFLV